MHPPTLPPDSPTYETLINDNTNLFCNSRLKSDQLKVVLDDFSRLPVLSVEAREHATPVILHIGCKFSPAYRRELRLPETKGLVRYIRRKVAPLTLRLWIDYAYAEPWVVGGGRQLWLLVLWLRELWISEQRSSAEELWLQPRRNKVDVRPRTLRNCGNKVLFSRH